MDYFNPSNYTYAELSRIREAEGKQELADAYDKLSVLQESVDELEVKWSGEDSSRDEQSEFRRTLIEDIKLTLERSHPRYKETKELISQVLSMISESYVEL
jgi:hypothetical protein